MKAKASLMYCVGCGLYLCQRFQFSRADIFSPGPPFPSPLPLGIDVLSLEEAASLLPSLLIWKNTLCRFLNQTCSQEF